MGQVFLVRHGQASFGAADYDQLSEVGLEQSRLLGAWFAGSGQRFGRVVTGSLKRHAQTARACLDALPAGERPAGGWTVDPGFDEYDHEEVLRRHRPEMADPVAARAALEREANPRRAFQKIFEEAMARWMDGAHDAEYRESWPAFRARCAGGLRRVVEAAEASQSTLVFTSGGPIAAICQDLLGVPDRHAAELNFSLVNSAVTKLLHGTGRNGAARVSLSYLNNFAHLEQTGQVQTITYR
ncbi:MAG: histidine phosphatase family protein [Nevskiaceae bacterium]